jgi:hypothetical protein
LSSANINEQTIRRLGSTYGPKTDLGPIAKTVSDLGPLLRQLSYQKAYPETAGVTRAAVNNHPSFKDLVKVNSLAAAMAPVGLLGYLAERLGGQGRRSDVKL